MYSHNCPVFLEQTQLMSYLYLLSISVYLNTIDYKRKNFPDTIKESVKKCIYIFICFAVCLVCQFAQFAQFARSLVCLFVRSFVRTRSFVCSFVSLLFVLFVCSFDCCSFFRLFTLLI